MCDSNRWMWQQWIREFDVCLRSHCVGSYLRFIQGRIVSHVSHSPQTLNTTSWFRRCIWQTWQHKGRATTQIQLRRVSSCCALNRWNSSNNFQTSYDTTLIGVFLAGCHGTWQPSPEAEVGLRAPDSAQFAAERSWKWYQEEETHFQIPLHLLPDVPLHWHLPHLLLLSPPVCRL